MRETKSARLTRMHDEYDILRQVIPAPACALHFSNPLELLIATVLSAQTTDKRVNTDTPELFAIRTFDPLDPALHHPEMKLDMDTADDFINLALRDIRPDITPREIVELFR